MLRRKQRESDLSEGKHLPENMPQKKDRMQLIVLSLVFAVSFVVGISYHLFQYSTGTIGPATFRILYQGIVIVGYTSLWLVLHQLFRSRRASPLRTLWVILVAATIFLVAGAVISRVGQPLSVDPGNEPGLLLGFDVETGVPLVLATIFKMNLLTLLQVIFVFVLLLKIQNLVLVKRSKSSQRNWYAMLIMMTIAPLSVIGHAPGQELNEFQTIAMIVAFVFMTVNSFRLSWIVFISFKEKMATIGLSLLVGVILFLFIGVMGLGVFSSLLIPGGYSFMEHYSQPIALFTTQAIIFGILYCTTAFLSLLFHLPTSSEYEQRAGERATMHSLAHLIGQVFDSENLYATIASAPVEAGSAHVSWLAVPDFQSGSLRPRLVSSYKIDLEQVNARVDCQALFEEVLQSRKHLLLDHAPADRRVHAKLGDGLGSLLITPLLVRNEVLGVLFAAKEVVQGFERDDIETIGIFAAQAAVAIDNARLFEQQVEKERLSRELSIAREVQKKLLPQKIPSLPGLSVHASSVSAQEVGGDYYDFTRLDENRLGIIIGDVSGKGTSAAFYMAKMQGIFHSVSRLAATPREFLWHANMALAESLDRNVFISVIYGIIDVRDEQFVLARAGHCPAALISQTGETRYLRTPGIGLGLDRGELFRESLVEETVSLQPGDVFALYTDGVVESRNAGGEEYGYDRLTKTLSDNRHEDAPEIHDAVLKDLQSFLKDKEYDDDMTLIIIKWHGIEIGNVTEPAIVFEESS
ncbi:MAG: SpoIIE family protein phosphatase [Bacteroidetes bacterium]|nr:SpoIIE family protein phosphatase [Bacteroidota bacterium]